MRVRDPTSLITLRSPDATLSGRCTLCTSVDLVSSARGHASVGIVLSTKTEHAMLEWIQINSCLCKVRLGNSVHANSSRPRH